MTQCKLKQDVLESLLHARPLVVTERAAGEQGHYIGLMVHQG